MFVVGVVVAHPPSNSAKIPINGITVVAPLAFGAVNALLFPTRNEAKDRRDDVKNRTDHLKLFDVEAERLEEVDNLLQRRIVGGGRGQLHNDAGGKHDATKGGNNLGPICGDPVPDIHINLLRRSQP